MTVLRILICLKCSGELRTLWMCVHMFVWVWVCGVCACVLREEGANGSNRSNKEVFSVKISTQEESVIWIIWGLMFYVLESIHEKRVGLRYEWNCTVPYYLWQRRAGCGVFSGTPGMSTDEPQWNPNFVHVARWLAGRMLCSSGECIMFLSFPSCTTLKRKSFQSVVTAVSY